MIDVDAPPMLVMLVGPPAVGKMTVGHELAQRTGLRLLHNHVTIDVVLRFFAFGTPPYQRLVSEFRRRIVEEVAASELRGLIVTFVWAFDDPDDEAIVESWAEFFRARGGRVVFVELEATQEERLRRAKTEFRLAEKPAMRDLAAARDRLLDADVKYQLNTHGARDARADWLRIDTSNLAARETAERIISHFDLRGS